MFTVRLVKCIWTHSKKSVQESVESVTPSSDARPRVAILERSVSLPFVPCVGLEIAGESWDSGPLQRVSWLTTEEHFRCIVADEFPRNAHGSELSYEFLLKCSIREGWVRPPNGGGDAPREEI